MMRQRVRFRRDWAFELPKPHESVPFLKGDVVEADVDGRRARITVERPDAVSRFNATPVQYEQAVLVGQDVDVLGPAPRRR